MANNDATSGAANCVPESEITSWRCITENVAATLDLELIDDAKLNGMRVGEFTSRVFSVHGCSWVINFYPNGTADHCAGHASIFVRCCNPRQGKRVNAKYTLSVVGKDGQLPPATTFNAVDYPGGGSWGHHKFIDKSKLRSLSSLGDGRFTVRCLLTLRNESPPLELHGDLERMLGDAMAIGADVTFRVGGQELPAHRSVLAVRSSVFRAQFFSQMMEMNDPEVDDMEPTIFKMLLHYLYTESLPRCEDDGGYNVAVMQHLLVAADRYAVERLKLICEKDLCDKVNMDTVTNMLGLASQRSCEQLKRACLMFMSSSPEVLGAIMETSEFKDHFMKFYRPLPLEAGRDAEIDPSQNFKRIRTK